MNTTTNSGIRMTTPLMRGLLLVASLLVFAVGITLNLLTDQTDKYFAWTVNPPLTAAFLGGGYWASCLLEYFCSRERQWAKSRIAVFPVFFFTFLTLVVTVLHKDRFHFDDPEAITNIGTYFWLGVYVVVPLLMAAILLDQWQEPGGDPERVAPIPRWVRLFFFIEGMVLIQTGILLLVTPENTASIWPWMLTPLTGRAVGAWLIGLGIAEAQMGWENDWLRVRPVLWSSVLFAGLELIALLRFSDIPEWDKLNIYVYIAILLSIGGKALYGFQQLRTIKAK
jgi:hypothetical protein